MAETATKEPQTEASAGTKSGRRTPQPEGQTIPGGGGTPSDDGYEEPITPQGPGTASTQPTITRSEKLDDKNDFLKSKVVDNFCKITGVKRSDILGFNEQTRVIVTQQGGKYQLNAKGNQVRLLQGPEAPKSVEGKDLGDHYVDARARAPFVGTAASINASVHESPVGTRGETHNQAVMNAEAAEMEAERLREIVENGASE